MQNAPLQKSQLGVQAWFFDRQSGANFGLLLADRGESCNGLGCVERNAVLLDAAQFGQGAFG